MSTRRIEILEAACRLVARRGVRGLRIEELAAEAGVSVALIYYYFEGREKLLRSTFEYVNERAGSYTEPVPNGATSPAEQLTRSLLDEIQDGAEVRQNSAVWGELRASAWFDEALREPVERLTDEWVEAVAVRIRLGQEDGSIAADVDVQATAERLTALVEGVSGRWLAGFISVAHARDLIREGIARELGLPRPAARRAR